MRNRVIIVIACLLLSAGLVARSDRFEQPPNRESFATFPSVVGTWRGGPAEKLPDRVLEVLGVDDYVTRVYYTPEHVGVGLYIGYWESQRTGDTIHSPLNCLPGAGWEPTSQTKIQIPDSRHPGEMLTVNRLIVEKGLERQLVLYWYQSHGRIVASEYSSKFYLVADAVRLNRTDGAIVRVIAEADGPGDSGGRGEATARRFIADLLPVLSPFLPN
jgi:EpsI family protein